ncbi:hypothetical protein NB311A_03394 [Nitrobacter sp. Nb-311A]|nr:hypothetical protein NB311A_03394 [Nitrobacter sp. Nb-311A]
MGGACASATSAHAAKAINEETILIRMERQQSAAADVPPRHQDLR